MWIDRQTRSDTAEDYREDNMTEYQVTFIVMVEAEDEDDAEQEARQHIHNNPHFEANDVQEIE